MAEITAALDEDGANKLLDLAIAAIPPQSQAERATWALSGELHIQATLTNGAVDLIPPDIIRIVDLRLDWQLDLSFGFDLSSILPDFCLPQVCIDIPCVGRVCTPRICIDWPTITVPVAFGDFLKTTVDLQLDISLAAATGRCRPRSSEFRTCSSARRRRAPGRHRLGGDSGVAGHPVHRPVPGARGQRDPGRHRNRRGDRLPGADHHSLRQRSEDPDLRSAASCSRSCRRRARSIRRST